MRVTEDPVVKNLCDKPGDERVPDGRPIQVTLPPAPSMTVGEITGETWRRPPVTDPAWLLNFQGLRWVAPLAYRAGQDGQFTSLTALIRQAVTFHITNPDPGDNSAGWDEGTALRRLQTENCLYALTHSAALIPGMTADVAVLTGKRYAGPPRLPVHNHGLMANIHMINAGKILKKPEWVSFAADRIVAEAPKAFSAKGVTFEQSSSYQNVNVSLWRTAGDILTELPGYADQGAQIQQRARNADRVWKYLTEPDGKIVQVGDSDLLKGRPGRPKDPQVLRDDETGWVIGRTSWTDPDATFYTVRYGPDRRAHGQEDRAGGLTWSAAGTRVLVGLGRYGYDTTDPLCNYRREPSSQNVASPPDPHIKGGRTSTIDTEFGKTRHNLAVTDDVYGPLHRRRIMVDQKRPALAVTDAFGDVPEWSQNWHLDPAWKLVSGKVGDANLTFRHPSGRILTVSTSGRVSGIWIGDKSLPYGWVFPEAGKKIAAYQLSVKSPDGAPVATTFRVT
ncbi:hypothetical protein [Actinoplanes sp. NPDC020271]|uniref:hypothetical protein n=1 Tax=Actinoplanes sp. NPDC020271 TaxID=3363896 RepID=UPI0037999C15